MSTIAIAISRAISGMDKENGGIQILSGSLLFEMAHIAPDSMYLGEFRIDYCHENPEDLIKVSNTIQKEC